MRRVPGSSWATVRRAKDRLGAKAQRQSEGKSGAGRWVWALQDAQDTPRCSQLKGEHLAENEHLAEPYMPNFSTEAQQNNRASMDPKGIYRRLPAEEFQPLRAGDDSRLSDRLNGGNGAGDDDAGPA